MWIMVSNIKLPFKDAKISLNSLNFNSIINPINGRILNSRRKINGILTSKKKIIMQFISNTIGKQQDKKYANIMRQKIILKWILYPTMPIK